MWSKADVVGGDSSIPKKPISHSPISSQPSPPKRNRKHVLSNAVINSDPSDDEESTRNASDESRFSDSEDDD